VGPNPNWAEPSKTPTRGFRFSGPGNTRPVDDHPRRGKTMAIDESGRTEQAKQEAKGYADDLRQRGQHVAEQAKQGAGRVAEEVKDKAHDQADRQMDRAAERLHSVADQLESMTQETDQEGILVDYALNGARRLHSLADHLEQDGIDGIIQDVENFARRRPGMFIAAGMGVGMVLGRWLKSADMDRVK